MKTEVIKDRMSGRILGYIDRYDNGDAVARLHHNGRIVGRYKASTNQTWNYIPSTIEADGDVLASLIRENADY